MSVQAVPCFIPGARLYRSLLCAVMNVLTGIQCLVLRSRCQVLCGDILFNVSARFLSGYFVF